MLNEYIEKLSKELEKRKIAEKDDIVQYFEEMITDRMESGEELEEILTSLGDASDIVNSLYGKQETVSETQYRETTEKSSSRYLQFLDVRDIRIENVSYDICFHPSKDDNTVIEFNDDEYSTLKIRCDDHRLKIEQDYTIKGIGSLFTSLSKIFSSGSFENRSKYHADIYLPKNADLDLKIESTNGDLSFSETETGKCKIDSVNGDIELRNCVFEEIDLDSVNGDLAISDTTIEESFSVDNVTADIKADLLRCEDIDIDTVSGDIRLLIDGDKKDYDIRISKLMKDISYTGQRNASLKVDTVSGDISWDFTR